jgi:hypothetical protein
MFTVLTQLSGVFSEPIWICILLTVNQYSCTNLSISGIYSCHIQKDEVTQPVEIALNAQLQTQGFILSHILLPGLMSHIFFICSKLVATKNTHESRTLSKFSLSSCHDICISSPLYQAFNALYTSYSLLASIFMLFLLNIFSIFLLLFAFIAYLVFTQKADGKFLNFSIESTNLCSL